LFLDVVILAKLNKNYNNEVLKKHAFAKASLAKKLFWK